MPRKIKVVDVVENQIAVQTANALTTWCLQQPRLLFTAKLCFVS
jgi:hypothetical protein